jgi:hypothetical protein
MNKRDIILVGAGVVVGYLLSGYLLKKIITQGAMDSAEPTVDQTKLADCTKKVEERMALTEFKVTANFDINAYKKNAIDNCMKGGAF